ncbi:carbamoyltransferase [Burkholderia ubonensis]|uniref:carbamoyltransferase family protein n=1 Tax=Burkholderia ubonensis TaxID=101571 RepID=UPI0007520B26|nr:carbamoyltransferase C-terminal domain-containing protein [Burkholderia ubonensis]KVR28216.1 carbamoyltransferase [Burkholderia ubonensis]KVU46610.1 carbamoyltransferase [Burkholderia ubonensis]KWD26514.1 carbamoyltransferase [Burkholderia ubonensis]KWD29404.1 carbamoyltransferase [Burkholderia ubonensis]
MHVLGISGLDRAISFREQHYPDIQRRELRITQGLDAAAALVGPGGIVGAAAEERFTGQKGIERFPAGAIDAVLARAGLRLDQVDRIAHGFAYDAVAASLAQTGDARVEFEQVQSRDAQLSVLRERWGDGPWDEKFVQVPHHLAHAASAYYPSGMDDALVFVSDGMGETESASIWTGRNGRLTRVASVSHRHSLGVLYGLFTLHLGFRFNSGEYKVMGLAPYGDPRPYFAKLSELVRLQDDGFYTIPILQLNETPLEMATYRASSRVIEELFGKPRLPDEPITQAHMDLAAALQAVLQNTTLHTLRTFKASTGARHLCMAGGVALNCTANGVVLRSRLFKRTFVQPASGDDGTALGAALYVQSEHDPDAVMQPMSMPFWGTHEDDGAIRAALDKPWLDVRRFDDAAELARVTADLLAREQIVGWFQGAMEFGPRALGNRSILADPRSPSMRARVNALVKKREDFRPFAPAVLAHRAPEFFDVKAGEVETFAHMLYVTGVKAAHRNALPAVTHCDGSARVQTVFAERNPRFYQLLEAFEHAAGIPILLNTSFNVRGQPIVRTAEEAVETFREARLDALVIGNYLATLKA